MIPIQEIDIYSDNNIKISAHIIVQNSSQVSAEISIYDPLHNNLYSAYQPIGQFTSASDAFDAILTTSDKYITKSSGTIVKINNPCNTEFLDKVAQQSIVASKSITVNVEVNA
ncbi:hypothetical protein [Vibrio cholerae]|uniref:hypothetical protein n=1 Tax=Vibrio cholerae TaxID=666 RepID=UPI0030188250|nr:hypothetical protein [Vibrio cholerae]